MTLPSFDPALLGWSPFFQSSFTPHVPRGLLPGRVALEHRSAYVLFSEIGEVHAELAGRLRHEAASREALPGVGDWVAFQPSEDGERATIRAVLPRRTAFLRGAAGGATEAQVVAANVDLLFLVTAIGADLNARRVERYLTLARATGAPPVVVLTKVDLAPDDAVREAVATLGEVSGGAPVATVSSLTGAGIDALRARLDGHLTVAIVGSSGSGKSTLVNRLAGDTRLSTGPMGVDGRGTHTTTRRELVVLPGGGLVIDTPGMRELRPWDEGDGLDETFADVAALAAGCRFRDCTHEREPRCAVRAALERGDLDPGRWASYVKLERELAALAARRDARAASEERRRIKTLSRAIRQRFPGR